MSSGSTRSSSYESYFLDLGLRDLLGGEEVAMGYGAASGSAKVWEICRQYSIGEMITVWEQTRRSREISMCFAVRDNEEGVWIDLRKPSNAGGMSGS